MDEFERAQVLSMKLEQGLSEKWIEDIIAKEPSIIGLGDLTLRQKEKIQPGAGRLDLLLEDWENDRRYEVELQLGPTDPSHIIRTIEYWDIERKRYPQYDHCAVLIAEDITSRFLNVISLFNGTIPLIAIQMKALRVAGKTTLVFTRVMDVLTRGPDDPDGYGPSVDRKYWENRASKVTMALVDDLLKIAKELDPSLSLGLTQGYIGMRKGGEPLNFVIFVPKKSWVRLEPKLPKADDVDRKIEQAQFDRYDYDARSGRYKIWLSPPDARDKSQPIRDLMRLAYEFRAS